MVATDLTLSATIECHNDADAEYLITPSFGGLKTAIVGVGDKSEQKPTVVWLTL